MRRDIFIEKLNYFNLVHGVTIRAISAFDDQELEFRPQPATRSVKELVFHIYAQEKTLAEAVRRGRFTAESVNSSNPESETVANKLIALKTTKNMLAYATSCHETAHSIWEAMKEEDLTRQVESPFGTFPAWKYFDFAYDEHWHHRGQLYTYLRLLGKEPTMLYDY
jgi:uncharacterized damage-inducible protein DinB